MSAFFTPLLDTVSASARTLWPLIQSAADKGFKATETLKAVRELGVSVRTQDFYTLFREATGATALRSDILKYPADMLFPVNRIREAVTQIIAPFSYTLQVQVYDELLGTIRTVTRQAHSSTLLPFATVANNYQDYSPETGSDENLSIHSVQVVDVVKQGPRGTL